MNVRTTWLLVLAALGLGGWIYWTERDAAVRVSAGDGGFVRFQRVVAEDIRSVEIIRSNLVIRVERSGAGWQITAPLRYPAQATAVEHLLEALAGLAPSSYLPAREVKADPEMLKSFGLETPETVTLQGREGGTILRLGAATALGRRMYFQRVGDDGVFATDAGLLERLPTSVADWRDRRLMNVAGLDFDRIEVMGSGEIEAVRSGTNGAWQLVRPLSARANSEQINGLLRQLEDTRITEFVTDSAAVAAEDYGLQPPAAQLVLKRGTNELLRLQVGKAATNAPGDLFVRRSQHTNVVRAGTNTLALLLRPLADFRDRRLLPSLSGLSRFELRDGARRTVLELQGTNWWVTEPTRFPADAAWLREAIVRLARLPIADFPNDLPTDLARYGLAEPLREYVFSTGADVPDLRLHFGAPYADSRRVYARRLDEAAVYGVPLAEYTILPRGAAQFRTWTLAPSGVARIEIIQKGQSRGLARSEDGTWRVESGSPGALIGAALDEALVRLGQVSPVRVPEPPGAALVAYGFELVDHQCKITLREPAGFRSVTLRFGGRPNAVNQFVLARFDDEPDGILTEFPLTLYRDFVGPYLGVPSDAAATRAP
jgi:hypothetical protein